MEQDQVQDVQTEPVDLTASEQEEIYLLVDVNRTDWIVDQWAQDLHQNIPALRETSAWNTLQKAAEILKRRLHTPA